MDESLFGPLYQREPVQLPALVQHIHSLRMLPSSSTTSAASLASYFPRLATLLFLTFEESSDVLPHAIAKVGVLFSGGQAPGGHNVVIGLSEALRKFHPGSELIGFKGGPDGLLYNRFVLLTPTALELYRNTGGFDLLGSGRTKIETEEQFAAVLRTLQTHQLTGLVIIGGDDSNTNAALLAEYLLGQQCATRVVGVPKTIDGDLRSPALEISFGFDTATKVYSELIGNVARDALSAKKYFHFIKLMGRSASHVALECALQTHPNLTLIGEEIAYKKMTLSQIVHTIADLISQRANVGKNYGVALIPEGLIEFIPEMRRLIHELNMGEVSSESTALLTHIPKAIMAQLQEEKDSHGNLQVSKIATEQLLIELIRQELAQRTSFKGKFTPVNHFFGYEGRAAYPTCFDASYCMALGYAAAALIDAGHTGYMAQVSQLTHSVDQWTLGGIPLTSMMVIEERKGKLKPVIQKTLVNLEGEAFRMFASQCGRWGVEDHYCYPGSIQYFGPSELTHQRPLTLQLEQHTWSASSF